MSKRPASEADITTAVAAIDRATARIVAPVQSLRGFIAPFLPPPPKEKTMSESIEVPLAYPLRKGSVTVSTLKLRRVKVADLNALDDLPPGTKPRRREVFLLGRLSDVPHDMLEELDAADYGRVVEALEGFFDEAPPTGGSMSSSSPVPPAGATPS
ncbi:phage tail assembly protein [Pseudoxanthobacter sp. M-2]|uniref:phage tail assembly protein n=1 Tax=Pseudoxanthobacter sp. M-2 TaxID=3078754 RepID=UPI0038FC7528